MLKKLREIMEKKGKFYVIALSWLLLMMFFTYTIIISESFVATNSFDEVHFKNQCSLVSLIVNCGLVFMIVFDYKVASDKDIPTNFVLVSLVGIVLAIALYGHANVLTANELDQYKFPLNWDCLSRLLHFTFLFILLYLKERVVELDMEKEKIVTDYRNKR